MSSDGHGSLDRPIVPLLNALQAQSIETQESCAGGMLFVRGMDRRTVAALQVIRRPWMQMRWAVGEELDADAPSYRRMELWWSRRRPNWGGPMGTDPHWRWRPRTRPAQWERRIISQQTKDALAVKRSEGVGLGVPHSIPAAVAARVAARRAEGKTLRAIARRARRQPTTNVTRKCAFEHSAGGEQEGTDVIVAVPCWAAMANADDTRGWRGGKQITWAASAAACSKDTP